MGGFNSVSEVWVMCRGSELLGRVQISTSNYGFGPQHNFQGGPIQLVSLVFVKSRGSELLCRG